jgi:hypothetical protein
VVQSGRSALRGGQAQSAPGGSPAISRRPGAAKRTQKYREETPVGWKTVRNDVERWARAHGVSGEWRKCANPAASLRKKFFEELGEFLEDFEIAELCDLRDVLEELARVTGPAGKLFATMAGGAADLAIRIADPAGEARRRHEEKVARMGTFSEHIEWTPVPAEHLAQDG